MSTQPLIDNTTRIIPPPMPEPSRVPEEKRSEKLAKEFVKWCFSFGPAFRNSPDSINLQSWMQKFKLKLKDAERDEVLKESRRAYLKKIEQLMKKADAAEASTEPSLL